MRHVFDSQNQRDTLQQRKVKGPEPGALRHHVGCVHKHLNYGTEEKQTRTTRASWKAKDWKNVTKLDYTSRFCATMFLPGSGPNNVSCRDGEPRPRRGGTQNTASQRRNTKQHGKGKDGSKLLETLIPNITRLLKRFHGFASSWSLLNQRTKRCWVSRDFTAARCDNKANKCTWLGRVSKTARVTLKIAKHEIPRKSSRTRAETNRERWHIAIDAPNVVVGIPENMTPNSEWPRQMTGVQNCQKWEVAKDYTLHNHTQDVNLPFPLLRVPPHVKGACTRKFGTLASPSPPGLGDPIPLAIKWRMCCSGNVDVLHRNRKWFVSRHIQFYSGFDVMAINEISFYTPEIIFSFRIIQCRVILKWKNFLFLSSFWTIPDEGGCFQTSISSRNFDCSICDWEDEFFTF